MVNWREDRGDFLGPLNRSVFLYRNIGACVDTKESILDVGCNVGRDLRFLSEKGYTDLTGIDTVDNMLSIPYPINIIRADASFLLKMMPRQFDVVLGIASFQHIANTKVIKKKIASLAKLLIVTIEMDNVEHRDFFTHDYKKLWTGWKIIHQVDDDLKYFASSYGDDHKKVYTLKIWERE